MCAQITGATAAAFTLKAIMVTSLHYHDLGTTTPSAGIYNAFQALTMEIIVTFNLMFVTMSVATDSKAVSLLSISYQSVSLKYHFPHTYIFFFPFFLTS